MASISSLLNALIALLIILIFVRVILDWLIVSGVMKYNNPLRDAVIRTTEPILAPIRRYARVGMLDLSPMIAIIVLSIIQRGLSG